MIYSDQISDTATKAQYHSVCERLSKLVFDTNSLVIHALQSVQIKANQQNRNHFAASILLARHVIEMNDAIGVLVAKGCADPCKILLRSLLEGGLGVLYIVEADSERRDLAYQVSHAHKRIKLYKKLDPTTPEGKVFDREMAGDGMWQSIRPRPMDWPKAIANLEHLLREPEFVPVEAEWHNYKLRHPKIKGDPAWYALFDGPTNVRELAIHLKMRGEYEFLYRHWSDSVHAGNAMTQILSVTVDGGTKAGVRPLRYPENLRTGVMLAVGLSLKVGTLMVAKYVPSEVAAFGQKYIDTVKAEYMGLTNAGPIFTFSPATA